MRVVAVVLQVLLDREQWSIAFACIPLKWWVDLFRGGSSWASISVWVAAGRRNVAVVGRIGISHVESGEARAEVNASDGIIGYYVIGLASE